MLIPLIVFFVVVALIFGAYWLFVGQLETREQLALRRRLKAERVVLQSRTKLLRETPALSSIQGLNATLIRFSRLSTPLQALIDGSGLSLTVGAFLLMTATAFFLAVVVVDIYLPLWWLALAAGLVAAALPLWVIRFFRTRRLRKFEEQFPEAIELISRAMRAGHAFATGLKMAADELPEPAGPEFKMLYERQNFGAQLPDALRSFAERIPLLDARFFVTAVLTQREAGGNLSEVLDRLAAVMRERFKIKREVSVRSAHGRMTAYVLACMPPGLAAFMMASNPAQLHVLLDDPLGQRMIMGAVVLQVLGVLLVRKIVDIRY
jgi:tight adherence protein B